MSLQGRLGLALLALLLLSLVPLGLFTVREARQAALETLRTSALARLGFYRAVSPGEIAPLSALAQEYGGYGFLQWQGVRRYTDTAQHELPASAEAALLAGDPYAALHGQALVLSLPLEEGAAGLVLRAEALGQFTRRLLLAYALAAALVLSIAALLGRWLVGALLEPLNALAREVQARTADNLEPVTVPRLSEIRPTAERLNQLLAELQQTLKRSQGQAEAAKRFAAQASHELRTPLAALGTYWEVLKRRPDQQEAAAGLERQLSRLAQLLEALLTLARLEGRAQAQTEATEVRAFVARRFPTLALEGSARILAESALLELALGNLLSNALRYGAPPVVLRLEPVGERVWLHFDDGGRGFPEALLGRALEPFVHGEGRGTGLGLAIVRAVAEVHGGEVQIANRPEGGARVSLAFSLAPASALRRTSLPD